MCYGKEAMNLVDTGMQRTLTEQVSPKTSDAPGGTAGAHKGVEFSDLLEGLCPPWLLKELLEEESEEVERAEG